MSNCVIYKITNLLDGRVYIGQTKHPTKRFREHCVTSKQYIGRSIKKHGKENFLFEVLCSALSEEALNQLEISFIEKYNSAVTGYNKTYGGTDRIRYTPETRKKMSDAQKGKEVSQETRDKISKSLMGKPSPKKINPNRVFRRGFTFSEEVKKKMSQSAMGRKANNPNNIANLLIATNKKKKKIYCIELQLVFFSVTDAAIYMKSTTGNIIKQIKGKTSHVKGYTFQYYNSEESYVN